MTVGESDNAIGMAHRSGSRSSSYRCSTPEPGVRLQRDGVPLHGVVQPYEPQYSDGAFPVRFDNGIWRTMTANDVTVVAPPAPLTHRKGQQAR